jgi:polysaccharide pyruvyl transferase WcaK-like protein
MRENCFAGNPPTVPPLQRAFQDLVLTDQDAESLRAVAVDYERKSAAFLTVAGPLSSEARFQSIDSGSVSEELVARIRNLDSEQDQMVSDEIKRLKEALGSERFEVLRKTVMAESPK